MPTDIYQQYAENLERNPDSLTDEEKMQAFLNYLSNAHARALFEEIDEALDKDPKVWEVDE